MNAVKSNAVKWIIGGFAAGLVNLSLTTSSYAQDLRPVRQQMLGLQLGVGYSANAALNEHHRNLYDFLQDGGQLSGGTVDGHNVLLSGEIWYGRRIGDLYYVNFFIGHDEIVPGGFSGKPTLGSGTGNFDWVFQYTSFEAGFYADLYRHSRFQLRLGLRAGFATGTVESRSSLTYFDLDIAQTTTLSGSGITAGSEIWLVVPYTKRVHVSFVTGGKFTSLFSLTGSDPQGRAGELYTVDQTIGNKNYTLLQFIPNSKIDNLDRSLKDAEATGLFIPQVYFKVGVARTF